MKTILEGKKEIGEFMADHNWEWVPNKSIGYFQFGQKIDLNVLPFKCKKVKSVSNDEEWCTYEIVDDKSRFSVTEGILISVECVNRFVYMGKNLIGLAYHELVGLFDKKLTIEDTWENGKEISCDELGIIIWVENDLVESISVST